MIQFCYALRMDNNFSQLSAESPECSLAQIAPNEMNEFIDAHNASVRDPLPQDFI
jgi:hypothetical protein